MDRCDHMRMEIVQTIKMNGDRQFWRKCLECNRLFGGIKHIDVPDHGVARIDRDERLMVPPCVVCGVRGVELHHWAPRALFPGEYEVWPTSYLCRACHSRWHRTTGTDGPIR